MVIQVNAGIIHQIQKTPLTSGLTATLKIQPNLHTANDHLTTFVEYAEKQLQISGRNSSISGGFGIQHTLSKILGDQYFSISGQPNYLNITKELAKGLYHFVTKKAATTGEYIPMIFYTENDIDYLLISLISLNKYINIDNGEFSDVDAIDNDALKVGIKVNLTAMKSHYDDPNNEPQNSYIQWIQRGSKKLPDYIQEFIPVSQKIDNTKATKNFIKYLQSYTEQTFEDDAIRNKVEADVYTLMRTKLDNNEPIHIEEDIDTLLETALTTYGITDKPNFSEYRENNEIVLDSSFKIDKENLNKVEKFNFSLKEKGITIKGTIAELGDSVKAIDDTDNDEIYLKITLSREEYTDFTNKYKSLSKS